MSFTAPVILWISVLGLYEFLFVVTTTPSFKRDPDDGLSSHAPGSVSEYAYFVMGVGVGDYVDLQPSALDPEDAYTTHIELVNVLPQSVVVGSEGYLSFAIRLIMVVRVDLRGLTRAPFYPILTDSGAWSRRHAA